jgi:hypothetical protein
MNANLKRSPHLACGHPLPVWRGEGWGEGRKIKICVYRCSSVVEIIPVTVMHNPNTIGRVGAWLFQNIS